VPSNYRYSGVSLIESESEKESSASASTEGDLFFEVSATVQV
jgi:hypothetical protein